MKENSLYRKAPCKGIPYQGTGKSLYKGFWGYGFKICFKNLIRKSKSRFDVNIISSGSKP